MNEDEHIRRISHTATDATDAMHSRFCYHNNTRCKHSNWSSQGLTGTRLHLAELQVVPLRQFRDREREVFRPRSHNAGVGYALPGTWSHYDMSPKL